MKTKTRHCGALFFADVLVAGHFLFLVCVSDAVQVAAAADDEQLGPALIKPIQQKHSAQHFCPNFTLFKKRRTHCTSVLPFIQQSPILD